MGLIVILIIVGVLMLVAELVLLPGLSFAGICSLLANGGAIYLGFTRYGTTGGFIILAAIVILSLVATVVSLRAKTWQRLSLKSTVDGTCQSLPDNTLKIGDRGVTVTRLAPIGKVMIEEKTYEAKSFGDKYIDPRKEIEVVGFENFNAIVRQINQNNQ